MAITIVATVGSASANSFVTEAEARAYLEARANSTAWPQEPNDAEETAQQQALVSATRQLSMLDWQGQRVDSTQALSWPRQWVVDHDAAWGTQYIASTVLPTWLKDATCELALEVMKAGTTDVFALPSTEGVIEKTVGPLTTRYADPYAQKAGLQRYPLVWQLVRRYLTGSGNGFIVNAVRS